MGGEWGRHLLKILSMLCLHHPGCGTLESWFEKIFIHFAWKVSRNSKGEENSSSWSEKRKYLNGPILEFLKFQINKPSIGEVKDVSGATQCIPLQHAMDFEQDIKTIFMAHVYQLFHINQIGNMIWRKISHEMPRWLEVMVCQKNCVCLTHGLSNTHNLRFHCTPSFLFVAEF